MHVTTPILGFAIYPEGSNVPNSSGAHLDDQILSFGREERMVNGTPISLLNDCLLAVTVETADRHSLITCL